VEAMCVLDEPAPLAHSIPAGAGSVGWCGVRESEHAIAREKGRQDGGHYGS
jgi:hypothetical protein